MYVCIYDMGSYLLKKLVGTRSRRLIAPVFLIIKSTTIKKMTLFASSIQKATMPTQNVHPNGSDDVGPRNEAPKVTTATSVRIPVNR